jgi:hypothetical protein
VYEAWLRAAATPEFHLTFLDRCILATPFLLPLVAILVLVAWCEGRRDRD